MKTKTKRPYRLEIDGEPWMTTTYATEQGARCVIEGRDPKRLRLPSGKTWRIALRCDGRKTTLIAEGVAK